MTRRQYCAALVVLAVSGLAGGLLGSWLLCRQLAHGDIAEVIEARQFRLVVKKGEAVAQLSYEDGRAGLAFYDTKGQRRLNLSAADELVEIALYDASGLQGASLFVRKDVSRLSLSHPTRSSSGSVSWQQITLLTSQKGTHLRLDGASNRSASISVDHEGPHDPVLLLYNAQGWPRAALGVTNDMGLMTLFDERDRPMVPSLSVAPTGPSPPHQE